MTTGSRMKISTNRISALSDGVFAIAMTLLVLDLQLPDLVDSDTAFSQLLVEQAPRFVSWLLSFAILCRLWLLQYVFLSHGKNRPRSFAAWNFVFLGAVSFTPFPTSLLSEHADQTLSVVVFSATLAVAGVALEGMRRVDLRHRSTPDQSDHAWVPSGQATILLLTFALAASLLAIVGPRAGVLLWILYPVVAYLSRRRSHAAGE